MFVDNNKHRGELCGPQRRKPGANVFRQDDPPPPQQGGDRAANSALHVIALGRLRTDPRTKAYMAKRIAEGHSKLKAIRCHKRFIAREAFALTSQRRREVNHLLLAA